MTLVQLLHTEQDVRIAFERDLRTENDHKWDALRKVNEDYQTGLKEIVQVRALRLRPMGIYVHELNVLSLVAPLAQCVLIV